ncbi:variant surface glycoprotein 3054 [Trypanosoma rangeli]|uniref:Variant surface glycoprotein 3054 n=1 Tax=Trypanosoma rangeli TaxID=5698 RepID=A0A422NP89_TRYRA|nr:variant surface glycoprotein 3054 [Trypanosoma rangeli]RNF07214.1 variant surface glycoprotein 3054 [Trypanosoma rangeli]|eukprot:RNF07214.1 variant surface glycoprotein 3054 [Trypanosoma rangeli]
MAGSFSCGEAMPATDVAALLRTGVGLYEAGDLSRARELAEEALHAAEPRNEESFAEALLLLSNIYCAAEDFAEAERLVTTCCCFVEEHLGAAHLGAATARLNRAIILLERYRLQGGAAAEVGRAYDLLQAVERRLEDNVGSAARLLLAEVLHNSGVCCELVGRYTDALTAYMRSMQIRVRYTDAAGVTDMKLALTMEHVAMLYRLMGGAKLQAALRLMEAVAATRRRYIGPRHPLYASAILAQGVIAAELGHKRRAAVLLRNVLEIRTRLYGAGDPQTRCVAQLLGETA